MRVTRSRLAALLPWLTLIALCLLPALAFAAPGAPTAPLPDINVGKIGGAPVSLPLQTLLLMTLLRMNGIPARWQSGWAYSEDVEGHDTMHDWGALYLAPYGWVPMDVTTGALASDVPALRDFYLGGLDGYRIAFNDDFGQPFARMTLPDSIRHHNPDLAEADQRHGTCRPCARGRIGHKTDA